MTTLCVTAKPLPAIIFTGKHSPLRKLTKPSGSLSRSTFTSSQVARASVRHGGAQFLGRSVTKVSRTRLFPPLQAGAGHAYQPMGESDNDADSAATQSVVFSNIVEILKRPNQYLPQVIIFSTALALVYPPSFSWFTPRYYAPALGFLMFAVGINLSFSDFQHALQRPGAIGLGYFTQFVVKPVVGTVVASLVVPLLNLPDAIGSGLILIASLSGAQLSNFATFLVEPKMAPLSIVMTALSTITSMFVTPALTLLLLGKRLPVNARGMMLSISQIVLVPIAAGLLLNRFAEPLSESVIKPAVPALSVLTTALCIGTPLARNVVTVRSPVGLRTLVPVFLFHSISFFLGYAISAFVYKKDEPLARTISIETGMQSSLLGLALANQFFPDPLVGIPCAISVIQMSLMGFALVTLWNHNTRHRS